MCRAMRRTLVTLPALTAFAALFITGCAQIENTVYDIRGLPPGKVSVVVDLTAQEAYLYAGGQLALRATISTGREGYNTSPGRYKVIQKDVDHRSSIYGEYIKDGIVLKPDANVYKDPKPRGAKFLGAPIPYFMRIYGGVEPAVEVPPGKPTPPTRDSISGHNTRRYFPTLRIGTPVKVVR